MACSTWWAGLPSGKRYPFTPIRWVQCLGAISQCGYSGVVESMITHEYAMEDVDVGFTREPGQIKAIIDVIG
jgi:hypothetical protein